MVKSYRTSEFWLTLLACITVGLQAVIDNGQAGEPANKILIGSLTILVAVYTVARSYVKAAAAPNTATETPQG